MGMSGASRARSTTEVMLKTQFGLCVGQNAKRLVYCLTGSSLSDIRNVARAGITDVPLVCCLLSFYRFCSAWAYFMFQVKTFAPPGKPQTALDVV